LLKEQNIIGSLVWIYFARYGAHKAFVALYAGRCPALEYYAPDGADQKYRELKLLRKICSK
jgi:hypothetical protein